MANKKRIGVLMGGISSEREVSLQSGNAVIAALDNHTMEVVALDLGSNFVQQIVDAKIDAAFIALHGAYGENGTIQAVLDSLNIPHTGSNMAACALAMNKWHTYLIWNSCNIPTPNTFHLDQAKLDILLAQNTSIQLPLAVKPASEGSSVGISKVDTIEQLQAAYDLAAKYDSTVIAQEWITGKEIVVGILDDKPLPILEIKTNNSFYDYNAKYNSDSTQYIADLNLSAQQIQNIQSIALAAFKSLGCTQYGRVDLMLQEDGKIFVIEVNTIPGMTSHSLLPMAAKASGIDFNQLVNKIISESL